MCDALFPRFMQGNNTNNKRRKQDDIEKGKDSINGLKINSDYLIWQRNAHAPEENFF